MNLLVVDTELHQKGGPRAQIHTLNRPTER